MTGKNPLPRGPAVKQAGDLTKRGRRDAPAARTASRRSTRAVPREPCGRIRIACELDSGSGKLSFVSHSKAVKANASCPQLLGSARPHRAEVTLCEDKQKSVDVKVSTRFEGVRGVGSLFAFVVLVALPIDSRATYYTGIGAKASFSSATGVTLGTNLHTCGPASDHAERPRGCVRHVD